MATEDKATVWLEPPGLLNGIASYIYSNAVNPVVEVAIAATCAYVGGIVGRTYNISRTGLNQYIILLARTAGGKEGAAQGMDRTTGALRLVVPTLIDQFIGPSEIASPQALIKQLAETPCMISHKGEIGFWLQKLCSKYANSNDVSLRGLLLDLFSKSGHGQVVKGSIYSDRAKNVPSINNPAFTLFGDSTQEAFFKAIDEESIAEGLIARLTIFECPDKRPIYNHQNNSFAPSELIVSKLATLVKRCVEKDQTNEVINIAETEEATAYHMAFREKCVDKAYEDRDSPTAQIWSRAHLRLLRLAGLGAVCVDPDNPCVGLYELQWAEQIVNHGIHVLLRRFQSGNVGENNYQNEQYQLMEKAIDSYVAKTWTSQFEKSYYVDQRQKQDLRLIHYQYLNANLRTRPPFQKAANLKLAFDNTIKQFIDNGRLVEIPSLRGNIQYRGNRSGRMFHIRTIGGIVNDIGDITR